MDMINKDKWDLMLMDAPLSVTTRLHACEDINERDDFHPEPNTLIHIQIVFDRLVPFDDDNLLMAAILHDITKPDTAKFNPKTGWITTPGHDFKSAKLMDRDPNIRQWLKNLGCDFDFVRCIVEQHIRVKQIKQMRKHKQLALMEMKVNNIPMWPTLQIFTMADTMNEPMDIEKIFKILKVGENE